MEAAFDRRLAALPRGRLARILWRCYSGECAASLWQARRVLRSAAQRAQYDRQLAREWPHWLFYPQS